MTRVAFALGTFGGAFLLFLVQPLAARQILPWFGGGSAVWSACLLFYQTALVAGYAYAHLTRRLGPRRQAFGHAALLVIAGLTLPVGATDAWKPAGGDALVPQVFLLLAATVGPTFVLLAATAPLLQDWLAAASPDRSPYRLYAVSNAGSLAALVVYPLLMEPSLDVTAQRWLWSAAYLGVAAIGVWCAAIVIRRARGASGPIRPSLATWAMPAEAVPAGPAPGDRARWVLLPTVGSGLLLATTSQLTQDVAAVPLLWVVPLALYLVTFILAFAGWYRRWPWVLVLAAAVAASFQTTGELTAAMWLQVGAALLATLTAACAICHGEVAAIRPAPRHLTAFYLALSAGGAIGGLFVALVAPVVFDDLIELPLLLVAAAAIVVDAAWRPSADRSRLRAGVLLQTAIAIGVAVAAGSVVGGRAYDHEIARRRGFHGVLRVIEEPSTWALPTRRLIHGHILHGVQFTEPVRALTPASYYAEGSGIAIAIAQHPKRLSGAPMAIGAIGLGTGTTAGWSAAGDTVRFFEIDPLVAEVSREYFTFVRESPGDVEVVLGDARLSLEREVAAPGGEGRYDVLAVDAFSGDAIPMHLLTREAFAIYARALAPEGVIAIHISNRYLDLRPVVLGLAADAGWPVIDVVRDADPDTRASSSDWLLATHNPALLAALPDKVIRPRAAPRTLLWTDTRSSLLQAIKGDGARE